MIVGNEAQGPDGVTVGKRTQEWKEFSLGYGAQSDAEYDCSN